MGLDSRLACGYFPNPFLECLSATLNLTTLPTVLSYSRCEVVRLGSYKHELPGTYKVAGSREKRSKCLAPSNY